MKQECESYKEGFTTAGVPIEHWKCYCGTTACLKQVNIQNLASISRVTQKRVAELTAEEEELFYKKALETKLL